MANAKLDVDIASFVSDINTAKGVLKGLNAEMKAADAEFKATGNSEQQLTAKTKTLNSQIRMQKSIVDNASKALEAMKDDGVDPADAAYQRMYATMMNANAGMNEAQAQLNALGSSAQEAATGADQLTSSVNKIGKKISLDQVISGIDKITTGLSNAAKKAVELGKELWNNVMDSAALSDDILTQATILDMTPEQYQKYKGVFDTIAEVTVKDWMNAKRKVEKAMNDPTNDQMDALKALGLGRYVDKYGVVRTQEIADNWEDGLWRIAGELQKRVSSGEISMEMADVYGEALFGKNFSTLKNLFKLGKEGFAEALGKQSKISDEALEKNAALNDKVIELQKSLSDLQAELVSAVAPALTTAAEALDSLLKSILEYLQTPEGQQMLEDMGDAVTKLFDGMKNINAEDVVNRFKDAFDKVTGALQWVVDNQSGVIAALKGIFGFWATLKVGEGALTILKVINGLKDLAGIGGSEAAGVAGVASGLSTALTTAAGNVAGFLGNTLLQNALPGIGDWFVHNTPIGHWWLGTETPEQTANDIQKNISTFQEDWEQNNLLKPFISAGENAIRFWDNFWKGSGPAYTPETIEQADWRPSYMKDQAPKLVEEITGGEPIDIPADIENQTTAADIAAGIGTVMVPGEVVFDDNGYPHSYANGINYVPYDGMLARLHKGERVMTAREVQSRSYNSNLYVESMYMNNGTDAAGLAAAMAAAQRRTMSGFGS